MMNRTIFEFQDYKAFLNGWIDSRPNGGHGIRSVIANETNCNPAYVTQVLSGSAHFSLEQAEKLRTLLGLNPEEFDFFVLLLSKERAGTSTLKKYFNDKMKGVLAERKQLKVRLKNEVQLEPEKQMRYFSSWIYSAVHLALTVPSISTVSDVAEQLGLEESTVKTATDFLLESGLITLEKGRYKIGQARFHLGHDSSFIFQHHANWRMQAMKAMDRKKETNLHYSSVVSISQADFNVIRESLLKAIEKTKEKIKASPEETVVSFCLDFFRVSAD